MLLQVRGVVYEDRPMWGWNRQAELVKRTGKDHKPLLMLLV